jgi:spore coat polysaccharide biosynthesis predicted glycosyltransferase SpsG
MEKNMKENIFQSKQVKEIVCDLLIMQSLLVGFTDFKDIEEAYKSFMNVIDKINRLNVCDKNETEPKCGVNDCEEKATVHFCQGCYDARFVGFF